jgi:undecaprenyl diphosphate synthase
MDGNGRWAKRRALPRELGHRAGVESMRAIIRESGRLGIEALTLYAFSTENWTRPREEVGALMSLMLDCFRKEIDELDRQRVRVRVIGDVAGLPDAQRMEAESAAARTRGNTGLQLNLALNYGGRDELTRAVRSIARDAVSGALKPEQIDEKAILSRLDTAGLPDVDLIIRTSGEMRLSNFLPYQSAYAEFVAVDTLWPDFTADAYHRALEIYLRRNRRFGGRSAGDA